MDNSTILLLTALLPLLGMVVVLALPKNSTSAIRYTSLGITVLQLVLSLVLWKAFDNSLGGINDPKVCNSLLKFHG